MSRKTSGQKYLQPRQADEALRQSEERFRALVEHSTEIIMILESDGTIRYRSPTSTGKGPHGYQIEKLIGKNIFDLGHPEDQLRARAFLADTLQRMGASPIAEFCGRHSDGS